MTIETYNKAREIITKISDVQRTLNTVNTRLEAEPNFLSPKQILKVVASLSTVPQGYFHARTIRFITDARRVLQDLELRESSTELLQQLKEEFDKL